jgi:hypothetical protein
LFAECFFLTSTALDKGLIRRVPDEMLSAKFLHSAKVPSPVVIANSVKQQLVALEKATFCFSYLQLIAKHSCIPTTDMLVLIIFSNKR